MKRQFVIVLLAGIIGAAMLSVLATRAGSVSGPSRPDPGNVSSAASHRPASHYAVSSTPVCGTINADTTWLLANSPYEVCAAGITIAPTATVTVQPGVTVQFQNSANNQLTVRGGLSAIGTLAQPITFTGLVATAGSWGGISATNTAIAPALVNLDYVTLDYGGVNGSSSAQLFVDQAVITVMHSLIRNSDSHGIYVTHNTPQVNIHDTAFIGNTRNAIQLNQPPSDILMSGLSASGNGVNAVFIAGGTTMNDRRQWSFPGIPYVVDAPVTVVGGGALSIEPGSELQFTTNGRMDVHGELKAIGTGNAPITLTGQTKTPGSWTGLSVAGVVDETIAQLDYVTIEYGGSATSGANIVVGSGGQLVARHSIIRFSSKDGVRLDSSDANISILNSQIINNTLYGVYDPPFYAATSAILATNNWWGDANGPTTDLSACSAGHGDRVTSGVLFRPVLASTTMSAEFPLTDAPTLTLTPRRWFAPADGITRVFFDITLRDGNGAALPGRAVNLSTSLGTATAGGVTDLNGKTLAYVVSSTVGDANVKASLAAPLTCEGVLSPTSKITFTPPLNITDLFPNSLSPYFDGDISVTPLPVIAGVTTTIHAKLTNPLPSPITVDLSLGYVQSSIGLAFGPISTISGQVIPANSSLNLAIPFVPTVSGHYCVQVTYNITAVGSAKLLHVLAGGSGRSQPLNINSNPGGLLDAATKAPLQQTENSLAAVNWFIDQAADTDPFGIPFYLVQQQITWMMTQAAEISEALVGDPPRQDYTQLNIPDRIVLPSATPPPGVSPALAAAMENVRQSLADVMYYGRGATTALDRSAGAAAAQDVFWGSQQANAMLYYNQQFGTALATASQALPTFNQELATENLPDVEITVSDAVAYQNRLSTQGFTTGEIAGYTSIGLTSFDIENLRQRYIAANPSQLAGSPRTKLQELADRMNIAALRLLHPEVFQPHLTVTGGGHSPTAPGNTLAQVYESVSTIQLGNPLAQTATIDVRARRIDLPADWLVKISPAQVSLAPGEVTTITVRIVPGAPTPQGTIPRVAVEGYAGNQLLGGVVLDVVVPNYVMSPTPTPTPTPSPTPTPTPVARNIQFSSAAFSVNEGAGLATITLSRVGDTSGTVTIDYATNDASAQQRTDYTITADTLTFGPGDTTKTFQVLIVDDNYVEGSETLNLSLSNPTGGAQLASPSLATLTIVDNDSTPPANNPLDNADASFFVRQHYLDFLSREPDSGGLDYWASQITQCGSDQLCIPHKRVDVSNAFFFELEFQQTGAYVFRLYAEAFGNNQPFPNPDPANQTEAHKLPSYAVFSRDRARVVGGSNLAQGQLDLANTFSQLPEFLVKYPGNLTGPQFVDAMLATMQADSGVDLTSQRQGLIDLFNSGGRGAVLYRLADDNTATNPINNRGFIDAEYNRAFVATEYFGYLRRDPDIGGFLFWLDQVNRYPIRNTLIQHAMVCAFTTSAEYQQRFSSVVSHTNSECGQ
ncbi:MAG TPA: Calx-beta domain-containing protein [Pyrinomonadaceae bacterium]